MMTGIFRLPQLRFGMNNNAQPQQAAQPQQGEQPQQAQRQRGADIQEPRPLGQRRRGMINIFEGMPAQDVAQFRAQQPQQPEQQRAPSH